MRIPAIALAFLVLAPAQASEDWWRARLPAVGVYGGLNRPSYSSSGPSYDATDSSDRIGFTYGASIEFPVTARTALEAAIFSNGIGVRETERNAGVTYSAGYRTTEIALLVRQEILLPAEWGLDLGAGVFREWIPHESEISDTTDSAAIPNGTYPIDQGEYSDTDEGLRFSIRARFSYDPGVEPFLQLDYRLGLKNLNKLPKNDDHSRLLLLLAGLRFDLPVNF